MIMNSWKSVESSACLPPLMMFAIGTGKVRANVAYKRHMLSNKSQKMKRKARGTMILSSADARIVKSYMPYG